MFTLDRANGSDTYLTESGVPFLALGLFFLAGGGLSLLRTDLPASYFLILSIAGFCIPWWAVRRLNVNVLSTRSSDVRNRTYTWVRRLIASALVIGLYYIGPKITGSRWFLSAVGAALAFAFGYPGVRFKIADNMWLAIYLLGLSASLLWWPGGLEMRQSALGIGAGSGFIVVALGRLTRFHSPIENHRGGTQ